MKVIGLAATILAALTACAPVTRQPQISDARAQEEAVRQMEAAIQRLVKAEERVANVYRPIRLANIDLCGEKIGRSIGAGLVIGDLKPRAQQAAYAKLFNANEIAIAVTFVEEGGPAQRAGLQTGDVVEPFKGMTRGELMNIVQKPNERGPITLKVKRGGETKPVEIQPELACAYPASVVAQDAVNAFADGKKIVVSTGLVNFVESDNELALVLGHELAHNTMDHIGKMRGNEFMGVLAGAIVGALLNSPNAFTDAGAAAGRGAFSQEFEGEADYVGVYHAARAGYQVAGAADLWRRMGAAHPTSIHLEGTTHPSTAKRFLAIEEASKEIEAKRASGTPLVPDLKEPGV